MRFGRVDQALDSCRTHLDATQSRNTEIEAYLVGYLLVTIYSAYEQRVKELVLARARMAGDDIVTSFVNGACSKIVRSIRCTELSGFLGHFDPRIKVAFQDKVNDTPAQAAYDNIVNNRHNLSHRVGTNMTFSEVERDYAASQPVLEALGIALGLSSDDLNRFV